MMAYSITEINQMPQADFVAVLGSIFESTPSIAQQAWQQRPFADSSDLHQTMMSVVEHMPENDQLALIQAHPDLGSRVQMAPDSVAEQASVGLDRLSPSEYERFQQLNSAYQAKFGFPFIMAVTGQTRENILTAFVERLNNSSRDEQQQALLEVGKIAYFRLEKLITKQ